MPEHIYTSLFKTSSCFRDSSRVREDFNVDIPNNIREAYSFILGWAIIIACERNCQSHPFDEGIGNSHSNSINILLEGKTSCFSQWRYKATVALYL